MPDSAAFPKIAPKPHLQLKEDLPGQIYTIDGFLSDVEQVNVLKWAQAVDLKAPTKPGKGEAERTARECMHGCVSVDPVAPCVACPSPWRMGGAMLTSRPRHD
jgi:hypothetical protein